MTHGDDRLGDGLIIIRDMLIFYKFLAEIRGNHKFIFQISVFILIDIGQPFHILKRETMLHAGCRIGIARTEECGVCSCHAVAVKPVPHIIIYFPYRRDLICPLEWECIARIIGLESLLLSFDAIAIRYHKFTCILASEIVILTFTSINLRIDYDIRELRSIHRIPVGILVNIIHTKPPGDGAVIASFPFIFGTTYPAADIAVFNPEATCITVIATYDTSDKTFAIINIIGRRFGINSSFGAYIPDIEIAVEVASH